MSEPTCRVCGAKTDAFLCHECCGEIARALGDAKSLMREVSNVATGQTNVYRSNGVAVADKELAEIDEEYGWRLRRTPAHLRSSQGRITLPSTRPMVNLSARELLWEAGNTLSTWARELAEARGVERIPDDWLTWMTANAEAFRFSEDAEQAHEEITYVCERMTRAVDRSPSKLYAGPCHAPVQGEDAGAQLGRCQRDLYAWPGAEKIVCDGHRGDGIGCGAEHEQGARRKWLIAEIDMAALPLAMWWQCLPDLFPELRFPPRQTWWRWAEKPKGNETDRRRLHPINNDRETGQELYSGRDVLGALKDYQEVAGTRGGKRSA